MPRKNPGKNCAHTVRDVMDVMERWAPAALACDWDRVGLHTGDPHAPVSRVVTCLSVTPDILKAARTTKAEMIVAHHPLIWAPLKSLCTDAPHTRLCLDIAHAGIACFAAHTNLDVVPGGVNTMLADQLSLQCQRVLFPAAQAAQVKLVTFVPASHARVVRDALATAGGGIIGEYTHCSFSTPGTGSFLPSAAANPYSGQKGRVNEEAELRLEMLVSETRLPAALDAMHAVHPYEEPAYDVVLLRNTDPRIGLGMRGELSRTMRLGDFARAVSIALECQHVRVVGGMKRRVRQVAVLGGSGGGDIARLSGDVDVFVTGDVKYHDALEALERGIAIIDAGHCATEKRIAVIIGEYLRKALPGLAVKSIMENEAFQVVLK